MNEAILILRAYYETLYERLEANKELLAAKIKELLTEELSKGGFENFDENKFAAYLDASLAFVAERIEAYNPVGIQYTFDRDARQRSGELELQLNWYDSSEEFEYLVEAARHKAKTVVTEENLKLLANELIEQAGAFPDRSIISAYEAEPALNKLPDYLVARAIEEIIR